METWTCHECEEEFEQPVNGACPSCKSDDYSETRVRFAPRSTHDRLDMGDPRCDWDHHVDQRWF